MMHHNLRLFILFVAIASLGCMSERTNAWHVANGWEADSFFTDDSVIALCEAIEQADTVAMEQLIADGADVNAVGKGGMTPLLWAFPGNQFDRFELLLRHGADPNVLIESDIPSRDQIRTGTSVTHLAARSAFEKHFPAVMKYGGDANLVDPRTGKTVLHAVIESPAQDRLQRFTLLKKHKVQVNVFDKSGWTPLCMAVMRFQQYDVATELIHAGADPLAWNEKLAHRAIHRIAVVTNAFRRNGHPRSESLNALIELLESRGDSLEEAEKDLKRWRDAGTLSSGRKRREMRIRDLKAWDEAHNVDRQTGS